MNIFKKVKFLFQYRLLQNGLDKKYWAVANLPDEKYRQYHQLNVEGEIHSSKENEFKDDKQLSFYLFFTECFTRYLYVYEEPALIEPDFGWLINEKNKTLFSRSFPYAFDPFNSPNPYPKTLKYINPNKKILRVDEAISIRYSWHNYYHFFIDTLAQFYLADYLDIPKHIPVVIPAQAKDLHYVKSFINLNKQLSVRPIIWQESNEFVLVKNKTYLLKDFSFSIDAIKHTLNSFLDCSFQKDSGERKIYLKRDSAKRRSITNHSEVEHFFLSKGYEVIDSEKMTLEDQIKTFSSASKIIGLHGAGLTNIIFRNGRRLELTEIFPEGDEPKFYEILSSLLGFMYNKILGSPLNNNGQFTLPLTKLSNCV